MPNTAIVSPQPGDEITSTWGQAVAGSLNGIQTGEVAIVLAGAGNPWNGSVNVTFPRPFQVAPALIAGVRVTAATVKAQAEVTAVTATGFTAIAYRDGGSTGATAWVDWIAVGVLA